MFFKYYLMLLKIRTTRIDRNYKIIKGVYTEVFVELYIYKIIYIVSKNRNYKTRFCVNNLHHLRSKFKRSNNKIQISLC